MAESTIPVGGAPNSSIERLERNARIYSKLLTAVDRRLGGGLSKPCRRVLGDLLRGPRRSHADIAQSLGMERSQISRVVAELIEADLISHEPSPHHRAQRLLRLTDEGAHIAHELHKQAIAIVTEVYEGLEPAEQRVVDRTLGERTFYDIPPGGVQIEPLELGLFSYVWDLLNSGYEGRLSREYASYVARVLEQQTRYFTIFESAWGLNVDNYRAGVCALSFDEVDINPIWEASFSHAHLALFAIYPTARGRGLANQLLAHCLERCAEQKVRTIRASVSDTQPVLGRLLRKHGFKKDKIAQPENKFGPGPWHTYRIRLGRA